MAGKYKVEEVYGARHQPIPPGWAKANADGESSHALIGADFYDLEGFGGVDDFLAKATTYQNYLNFLPPNSYKANKTSWEIIRDQRPGLPP